MGKFIVIEGIDRSGKSTLAKNIAIDLKNRGKSVLLTHEPTSYFDSGLDILSKLKREDYLILLAMFIRDRIEHNRLILKSMNENDFVICDRYSLSSLAYQGVFLKEHFRDQDQFYRWIENVLSISHIDPDLTIFIDFDGKSFRQGDGEKRELEIFEENEYLKDVYNIYIEAIRRGIFSNPGRLIGGNGSKEEMLNEAMKEILLAFHIQ